MPAHRTTWETCGTTTGNTIARSPVGSRRELDPQFATVWRNLGLAYFNKRQDSQAAWQAMERAFALGPADARVLYELDQLARRLGHSATGDWHA